MEGQRVKLTIINPYLTCYLCQGYLVDATTVAECLHSFCRSCIFRHLEREPVCPRCNVQVQNNKPYRSLRADKTLQDIVYKLVPGLFRNEMQRRRDFYKNHPHRDEHLEPECRGVGLDRVIYSLDDPISISLEFYDEEREKEEWSNHGSPIPAETDSSGPKRFLQCPAGLKMHHLKKFLREKYGLNSTFNIDILYKRETLPDSYSLMDIAYMYTWKRNGPMRFYYRMPEVVMKELIPPPEVPLISNDKQEKEGETKMAIESADTPKKDTVKPSEDNEKKEANGTIPPKTESAETKKMEIDNPTETKSEKVEDPSRVQLNEKLSKNGAISIPKQDELPVSVLLSLGQSRVEEKTNDHKFLVPPVPPKNGLSEKINNGKVNTKLSVNKIAKELAENKAQANQAAIKENMQNIASQLQQHQHQQIMQKQKQMQLQKQTYYQKQKQSQIKQQPLTQQKQQMSHQKQLHVNQQKQQQLQLKQQQLAQQKQHIQHIIQQQQLQHQLQQQQLQQFHQQQLQQLQTQQHIQTQQQLHTQQQQQLQAQQPIHLIPQTICIPGQQQQIPMVQQVLQVQQCVQQPQVQPLSQPQQVQITSTQNAKLQTIGQQQIQFSANIQGQVLKPSTQHSKTTQEHSVTSTVSSSLQNDSVSSANTPTSTQMVAQQQSPLQSISSSQLSSQQKVSTPLPLAKQPTPPPTATPPPNSTPPLKIPTQEMQTSSPKTKPSNNAPSNITLPTSTISSTENVDGIVQKSSSPQPVQPSSQFHSNRNLMSGGNLNITQNGLQSKSPQLPNNNIQQSNAWQEVSRTDISSLNGNSPNTKTPQVTLNTSNGSLTIMAQPKSQQNIGSPVIASPDASSVSNGKSNESPRPQGIHQNLPRTVLPKSPLVNGKAYQKAVPQKNISGQRLNNNVPEIKNGLIQQSNINSRLPTFPKANNARKAAVQGGVVNKNAPTLDQRIQQLYNAGQANKPTSPAEGGKSESRLASWLNNRFKPPQSPKEESEPANTTPPKSEVSVMRYKRKLQELQKDCEITQENPRPDDPKRRREVMPDVSIELMRAADMKKLEGGKKEKRPVPGLKSIQEVGAKRKKEDDSVLDLSSAKPGEGLRPHLPWLVNRPPPFIPRPT